MLANLGEGTRKFDHHITKQNYKRAWNNNLILNYVFITLGVFIYIECNNHRRFEWINNTKLRFFILRKNQTLVRSLISVSFPALAFCLISDFIDLICEVDPTVVFTLLALYILCIYREQMASNVLHFLCFFFHPFLVPQTKLGKWIKGVRFSI